MKNKKIKPILIDCTLRDGGYYNSWNFPTNVINTYLVAMRDSDEFRSFGRKSILEQLEDIELLRFLELNKKILMIETKSGSLAVDIPKDIPNVESALRNRYR